MSNLTKIIGLVVLAAIVYFAITLVPQYQRAAEIAEKMKMEYVEETFINMDQYFASNTVSKSVSPFTFATRPNID